MYPSGLVHLTVSQLISGAGGDPWELDEELQAGDPAAVNALADAYHQAAGCVDEAESDFVDAKKKFQDSYRRNGAGHPINDSSEVTATTEKLRLQRSQIAGIAVDLETIAAALASAHRASGAEVAGTNTLLNEIDDNIAIAEAADQDASPLYQTAIDAVRETLSNESSIRSAYLSTLHSAQGAMLATTGYTAEVLAPLDAAPDDARAVADQYDQTQRAEDQATVAQAAAEGIQSEKSRDAAARLRDSDTVHNPAAEPAARRLAGERLVDYRDSQLTGPLPKDPVMGTDARSRAQGRLEGQKLLESGFKGNAQPITPDQATMAMDRMDAIVRQGTLDALQRKLIETGVSPPAANRLINEVKEGRTPGEVIQEAVKSAGIPTEVIGKYLETSSEYAHTGTRWQPEQVQGWAKADAEKLLGIGKTLSHGAKLIDVGMSVVEVVQGKSTVGEEIVKTTGGIAGGAAGSGAAAGLVLLGGVLFPEVELPALAVGALYAALSTGGSEIGKNLAEGALG